LPSSISDTNECEVAFITLGSVFFSEATTFFAKWLGKELSEFLLKAMIADFGTLIYENFFFFSIAAVRLIRDCA
jgi:hypothetical protein